MQHTLHSPHVHGGPLLTLVLLSVKGAKIQNVTSGPQKSLTKTGCYFILAANEWVPGLAESTVIPHPPIHLAIRPSVIVNMKD